MEHVFSPPLFSMEGSVESIRQVVKQGPVNRELDGFTPLGKASQQNDVPLIQALVQNGADVNGLDSAGRTAICIAAGEGHMKGIRALVELGGDVNTTQWFGVSPIQIAAWEGHADVIRTLVELGGNVNTPDTSGSTPLYCAAEEGHVAAARTLLELGGNVYDADCEGITPLHVASKEGHVEVIDLLVEFGSDVNSRDIFSDFTPMHYAVRSGQVESIRALFKHGAGIGNTLTIAMEDDQNILTVAVEHDRLDVCAFLVNTGVEVMPCLTALTPRNPHVIDYIRAMVTQLWESIGLVNTTSIDNPEEVEMKARYALFSLTKLMSSVIFVDIAPGNENNGGDDGHKTLLETNIASHMRDLLSNAVLKQIYEMRYGLKRRLVRIAWRVYQSSLLLDSDRISVSAKARRYLEVVCLLFDSTMLSDVLSLRMTCKSNHERRRFPVYFGCYHELEANLIEEWIGGYGSSRFVSTDILHAVIAIHSGY